MKARFLEQQPPVKIVQKDGVDYIFICQNETQGTETYPDMGEGQTEQSYYEYDYNEFAAPVTALDLEEIQVHPENYLDYAYKDESEEQISMSKTEYELLMKRISALENVVIQNF